MTKNFSSLAHNKYTMGEELEKNKNNIEQLELEDRNEERKIYKLFY